MCTDSRMIDIPIYIATHPEYNLPLEITDVNSNDKWYIRASLIKSDLTRELNIVPYC